MQYLPEITKPRKSIVDKKHALGLELLDIEKTLQSINPNLSLAASYREKRGKLRQELEALESERCGGVLIKS